MEDLASLQVALSLDRGGVGGKKSTVQHHGLNIGLPQYFVSPQLFREPRMS